MSKDKSVSSCLNIDFNLTILKPKNRKLTHDCAYCCWHLSFIHTDYFGFHFFNDSQNGGYNCLGEL